MKRIIGVCACPAGIAHTYMAAENLERQGKKLGFQGKMERFRGKKLLEVSVTDAVRKVESVYEKLNDALKEY